MSEVYFLKQIEDLKKGKTNEKIEKQFKKLLKKTKLMKKVLRGNYPRKYYTIMSSK
ncbi:hypothetical protein [Enterococcus hirae]|uniref:hypothetical protein n=1 Tax=Enterococcus hirae TaxID=1354 RepID=UPI002003BE1B|nr:hypothetical protein [Enterococcus hirae]MCK6147198.1 hypothetical protein [Enterococcus hirae]MCK6174978.1 hypothetical protein [Enterococcus hirae]